MSDICSRINSRAMLAASVGLNLFLVAFVLGRLSAPVHHTHPEFGHGPMMEHGLEHHHGGPPPFFGPDALFSPDEMQEDEARMRADFDKMRALRQDFAQKLDAPSISKDEVMKHFAAMENIVGSIKKEAQERAAAKISSMTQEQRRAFAQSLLERDGGDEPPPPPHD